MLHHLTEVLQASLGSPWLWLAVFAVSGLDALLPLMPSETTVIALAVLLGPDPAKLALLVLVAAAGAFAGDCLGYGIGRAAGLRMLRRWQRGERGQERYEWSRTKVQRHAPTLIIAGRYLPGGRVASALATGSMRFPIGRFAALDTVGVGIWASYSVAIGYVGGLGFAGEPVKGLLLAFGIGLLVVAGIEVGRRLSWHRAAQGVADVPGMDSAPAGPPPRWSRCARSDPDQG